MALKDRIDFVAINNKAQICIDKCNRLCKGKSKSVCKPISAYHYKFNHDIAIQCMHMLRMHSTIHVQCFDESITSTEAADIVRFQRNIRVNLLPYILKCTQARKIMQQALVRIHA